MPRPPTEQQWTWDMIYITRDSDPNGVSWSNQNFKSLREWTNGQTSPLYPDKLRVNPILVHVQKAERETSYENYYIASYNWKNSRGVMRNINGVADPPAYSLASLSHADDVERVALSRLISKISRQKVNIAQNIGEYRQVQNMFMLNTKRLVNAYRAVRHADVYGLYRAIPLTPKQKRRVAAQAQSPAYTRNPAQWWLELQYGWLPLIGDVYDGLTNFYRKVEEGIVIKETAGKSSSEDIAVPPVEISSWTMSSEYINRKVAAKAGLWYKVDNARLANLQDWGVLNPRLLAWELLPYSFVVDWFLPVGDWLAKVDYSLGLSFQDGYVTKFVKGRSRRVYKPKVRTWQPSNQQWSSGGADNFEEVFFDRRRLSAFPSVPPPRFVPDGLRGKRIANALALLRVAFSR